MNKKFFDKNKITEAAIVESKKSFKEDDGALVDNLRSVLGNAKIRVQPPVQNAKEEKEKQNRFYEKLKQYHKQPKS